MGTITAIRPQRRPGRYNIIVDGQFALAVGEKVLFDLELKVGLELDQEALAAAAKAEDRAKAIGAGLRLLESRPRSKKEIEDRLQQHGYDTVTIAEAVDKLAKLELVDDRAFATAWIDSRTRCSPSGTRKLKSELIQKGIARETIDSTLARITEDDELILARAALGKRSRPLPADKLERHKEYVRHANFLARRGFSWTTTRLALKEIFGGESDEDL